MLKDHSLVAENITFGYQKNLPIIRAASIQFQAGQITALIGSNGSGKTTFLKILSGIFHADQGQLFFQGKSITKKTQYHYKKLIGFMPELLQLYPNMKVQSVLFFLAKLKGCSKNKVTEILDQVDLQKHAHRKVKALSKGMQQRLNLAQALINSPEVLLLDEPSNGLDYTSIISFYAILRKLAAGGATIILSSHQLGEVMEYVDLIAVLRNGHIILHDHLSNVFSQANSTVETIHFYFDKIIRPEAFAALSRQHPELTSVNETGITVALEKQEIGRFIVAAKEQGLELIDLKIKHKTLTELITNIS
ncbi:MAG: ABC transporter ATP-binding protein [Gammaproteobacteria bacterium]